MSRVICLERLYPYTKTQRREQIKRRIVLKEGAVLPLHLTRRRTLQRAAAATSRFRLSSSAKHITPPSFSAVSSSPAITSCASSSYRQHINIKMSHACETCDRWFGSWVAARQHMDALDHWDDEDEFECDKCDRTFTTQAGCNQHMTDLGHWYTDLCDTCDRRFVNKQAAEQHMDALDHHALPYCASCDRYFQKTVDLFQHMNSSIHVRADPIHTAPTPPVSSVPVPQPAPVHLPTLPAASFSFSLPSTIPQGTPQFEFATNIAPARPVVATPPAAPAPAVIATQPTTGMLSNAQLAKPCTTCIPFNAFIEKDPASIMLHYQSITSMRPHRAFSFEELRLGDYRAGCSPTNNGPGAVSSVIYRDQSTQTDILHHPTSPLYLSATSSRTTTPNLCATNFESRTTRSSTIIVAHTQEDRTALTCRRDRRFPYHPRSTLRSQEVVDGRPQQAWMD